MMNQFDAGCKTTFWNFLSTYVVKIPIIQRDYAQGRIEKKSIRESFLHDLKNALDENLSSEFKELKLDYVYGAKEIRQKNDALFLPLDGQQRLTTLWLLHWYLAYKEGRIRYENKENKEDKKSFNDIGKILSKFSYETRDSSSDFCRKLVEFAAETKYSKEISLKEKICSNIWYYKAWNYDPTIKAMLIMIQAMDSFFGEEKSEYWELLTSPQCPIVFFVIDLGKYKLTDDLYMKMNARGKALTSFENFKADFIGFIERKVAENQIDEKYTNPENGIPIKLDSSWTDVFWQQRSLSSEIDEIYYAFINRFIFNEYISNVNGSGRDISESEIYKFFYGVDISGISDDALISYDNFDFYSRILNTDVGIIEAFYKTMNNISKCQNLQKVLETEEIPFSFIPVYDIRKEDSKIINIECNDFSTKKIKHVSSIDQRQRPVFYAICKYLEYGTFDDGNIDEYSFHQWIRVCKNLNSDPRLRNVDSFVSIIKRIKELVPYSHNIYEYLASIDVSKYDASKSVLDAQFIEECEKASRILECPEDEKTIEEIENSSFFDGQIRFIYKNAEGKNDWEDIPLKKAFITQHFSKSGVNSVEVISNYISMFSSIEQLEKFMISLRKSAWIEILLNPIFYPVTHKILLQEKIDPIMNFESQIKKTQNVDIDYVLRAQKMLCTSGFLNLLCNESNDGEKNHPRIHIWWEKKFVAVYQNNTKASWKIYLIGNCRNMILSDLFEDTIPEDTANCHCGRIYSNQLNKELSVFSGWSVSFVYKSQKDSRVHFLKWTHDDNICRYEDGEEHLLFSANDITNSDDFLKELENKINE